MLVAAAGRTRLLLEWLAALPDALVRANPTLCTAYATALHLDDQLEEAEARLADAEEAGQVVPGLQVLQALTASVVYCFGLSDVLREWNRLEEAE